MKLLILLFVLLSGALSSCPVGYSYTCNSSLTMCKKQSSSGTGEYELKPCTDPNTEYCPSANGNQNCAMRQDKLPGIKCQKDVECLNGKCVSGKCTGISAGSTSSDWKKCDIGLTSINNICQKQMLVGESCNDDSYCTNDAVCVNSKCYKKWSLPNDYELGEYACQSYDQKNYACQSGSCYILRKDSKDIGYCSPTKATKVEFDKCLDLNKKVTCATSYIDGQVPDGAYKIDYGDCMEIHGTDGFCLCESQPGDKYYSEKIEVEKLLLGLDNNVCKVAFDPECWYQSQWDKETQALYKQWYQFDVLSKEGETVYDWDENSCIPKVFYPWYLLWQNVSTTLECSKYKCTNDLAPHVCIQYIEEIETFKLNPCNDDVRTYCNKSITLDQIECQELIAVVKKYPGQSCSVDNECISRVCSVTKKCQGKVTTCTLNSECEVGYYCDGTQCKTQKKASEKCQTDFECQNFLICFNQFCTKKFSIQTATSAEYNQECKSDRVWEACDSFTCESTGLGKGKCVNPFLSINQPPTQCDQNSAVCIGYQYENQENKIKGTCECGLNQDAEGFCNQFTGDWAYSLYKSVWQELESLNNDQGKCHTELRQNVDCWKQNWPDNEYLIARIEQLQIYKDIQKSYSGKVNTEDCVDQIYNLAESTFYEDFNILECRVWNCADLNHTLKKDHCIQYWEDEQSFYVDPCDEKSDQSFCQPVMNEDDESMCQEGGDSFKTLPLYPGDKCDFSYECITKQCSGGRCWGLGENKECLGENDFSCKVGFACILEKEKEKYKCLKQRELGQQCQNDYQCINKAVCRNDTCFEAYSGKIDQVFTGTCDASRINIVCETSQCNPIDAEMFACKEAYKSRVDIPVACQVAQIECASSQNSEIFTSCDCSLTQNKIAFCGLHPGDKPFVKQIQSWKNISDYDQGKCHTKSRFNMWCWQNQLPQYQFLLGLNYTSDKYFSTHYPQLIKSQDCVQQVYHKQYWDSLNYNPSKEDYGAIFGLFSTLLFILF